MIELREYQHDVIDRLRAVITAGHRRPLLVAPTGSGKTIIAAEVVRRTMARDNHVLFLAHRRELIHQASRKLHETAISHGVLLAGEIPLPDRNVQVASVQTLWSRALRREVMELPPADLVIVDEAHRARAKTYQRILDAYPKAVVLGLTATPCRGDGRGLGNVFDILVECPSVAELIAMKYLVPTRVYAPSQPDLEGLHVRHGDYLEPELAERMDTPKLVGDIVTHWHRHAERRKTVVFATGIDHSIHLRDEFRRSGVVAEHIDGTTPREERDQILERLSRGEVDLVTNCMVLTEGWDQPDVSCCVLARPTKHMGLYRQMVGRVLRPAEGKVDAVVLDHAGAVFEHGFVEDPVLWMLDSDKRAESPTHTRRKTNPAGIITCSECGTAYAERADCPSCGHRHVRRGRDVAVLDGQLGEVGTSRRIAQLRECKEERERWYAMLAYICEERGYNPGWTKHKYKEKFGVWPRGVYGTPQPPDAEVRSWELSRRIAWAKSQRRASS